MLHREHSAMFARIGTVADFTPGPCPHCGNADQESIANGSGRAHRSVFQTNAAIRRGAAKHRSAIISSETPVKGTGMAEALLAESGYDGKVEAMRDAFVRASSLEEQKKIAADIQQEVYDQVDAPFAPAWHSRSGAGGHLEIVEPRPRRLHGCQADTRSSRAQSAQCQVPVNGAGCVPALVEMMRESINVGRQLAIKKPVCRIATRSSRRRVHGDLLKWGCHSRTPPKLCRVQWRPISLRTQRTRQSCPPRTSAICII
jgi:hypothetical protein